MIYNPSNPHLIYHNDCTGSYHMLRLAQNDVAMVKSPARCTGKGSKMPSVAVLGRATTWWSLWWEVFLWKSMGSWWKIWVWIYLYKCLWVFNMGFWVGVDLGLYAGDCGIWAFLWMWNGFHVVDMGDSKRGYNPILIPIPAAFVKVVPWS